GHPARARCAGPEAPALGLSIRGLQHRQHARLTTGRLAKEPYRPASTELFAVADRPYGVAFGAFDGRDCRRLADLHEEVLPCAIEPTFHRTDGAVADHRRVLVAHTQN